MKIELFDHALPYFFAQRIHDKDSDNLLELERGKGVLESILRWEDDGGKIIEINHAALAQRRKKPNA